MDEPVNALNSVDESRSLLDLALLNNGENVLITPGGLVYPSLFVPAPVWKTAWDSMDCLGFR